MMYFLIILFFGSLLGIVFMIGRKMVLIQNGQVLAQLSHKEATLRAEYLEELKHLTLRNIKKHGYAGLVATIRFYVKSSNIIKGKYQEARIKIRNIRGKNLSDEERKEVSGFLKMISEYKHKIREIKHKIREEESL